MTTIGKLHYKADIPETGFSDQRIPLHVNGSIGDLTHCIRESSMSRPALRKTVLDAGPGDSDYLHYDEKVAQLASDFLNNEGRENTKPWCLFVGFVCPHFPWKVPQDIMDLYTPYDKIPLPADWELGKRPEHAAIAQHRKELCLDKAFSEAEMRKAVASYYGMVTFVDRQIGIVLDALEACGLSGNTRILYTTDHGDSVGAHGLFFKHTMYEGSVGIPMIMAGPDIPKGDRVNSAVSLLDVFPTVLECVGAQPKPEDSKLPGSSLLPFAKGEKKEDRPIFSETHCIGFYDGCYMVRYKKYKYVYFVNFKPQLFDLEGDPDELHDLIQDPRFDNVAKEMDAILKGVCDPEAVNREAHKSQDAALASHGGKDEVLKTFMAYTPIPKELIKEKS